MTETLRRPAALGVVIALVVFGGWWKLLWQPQGAALASVHRQTQAAASNLLTVEQNIGHLKHLKTISPQLTALEKTLSAAVPPGDAVDQFILTLNDLVQQSGVTISTTSLSPPTGATTAGLGIITIHLTVTGDYFAVQHFLDALRGSARIVIIDALAETPVRSSGKAAISGVSATMTAHLLTGLAAPSGAAAAIVSAPPTTAAPTGIISGPVTKARNAVANANANTAQVSAQANAIGGS